MRAYGQEIINISLTRNKHGLRSSEKNETSLQLRAGAVFQCSCSFFLPSIPSLYHNWQSFRLLLELVQYNISCFHVSVQKSYVYASLCRLRRSQTHRNCLLACTDQNPRAFNTRAVTHRYMLINVCPRVVIISFTLSRYY